MQGCGVVKSPRFLGGVGFLTTLEIGVGFFVRLRMSDWIIFYMTLLNWQFLLQWYNFFGNFCWNSDFLLCTTISIGFNNQTSFLLCWGVKSRKFWKGRSRIFYHRVRNHGLMLIVPLYTLMNKLLQSTKTRYWRLLIVAGCALVEALKYCIAFGAFIDFEKR